MDTVKKYIYFHRPSFGVEEEKEILETLRSGWITTGERTKKFEADFERYTGAAHAIGLNSCTAGLHLALICAGIKEGDEVITTPTTFPATANVIVHCGATPVFVDVEHDTLNIDVSKIEEKITPRTKAVMPVHFVGQPCDMDAICELAKKYSLTVIEDAAHGLETIYKNRKIGAISDFTSFSFYATKNITTGEGGMVTTNNPDHADKLRILSLHGISKDAWKRYSESGYKHWEIMYPGFKYNMFDIQAALGIHQLKKVDFFWQRRKEILEIYNSAFSDFEAIEPVMQNIRHNGDKNAYHLYVIRVNTDAVTVNRDVIMNMIQEQGIGVGVHFRAVHISPYYSETFGYKRGMLPVAEFNSDRVISLPIYPSLTDNDLYYIIETLKSIFRKIKR